MKKRKEDILNNRIERFINDIPWVQNLGLHVEVGDGHTGFTGILGKSFSATPLMFAEIEGMIHGIRWWESQKRNLKGANKAKKP